MWRHAWVRWPVYVVVAVVSFFVTLSIIAVSTGTTRTVYRDRPARIETRIVYRQATPSACLLALDASDQLRLESSAAERIAATGASSAAALARLDVIYVQVRSTVRTLNAAEAACRRA